MRVLAALGGNALLTRGQALTAENQRENVRVAAASLAGIVRGGHELIVTHGNGPQIGLLALQGAAYKSDEMYPLDIMGAETEGMIGYLIEQELENALGHDRPVATLLTTVLVDAEDPAFGKPTKFVGPVYDRDEAERIAEARGWQIAQDGDKWRRVVASPVPQDIPDLGVIRLLADGGAVVICAGGGGIPVVQRSDGSMVGVEAVVDKDATSALLADRLNVDALLMLTDVNGIQSDFGTETAARIERLTPEQARQLDLPAGSMKPKALAAAEFAAGGGARLTGIGRLKDAVDILDGRAGTVISETAG